MKTYRRAEALLLSLALIFLCGFVPRAENNAKSCECGNTPVIIVDGMNAVPLVLNHGEPNERQVWEPPLSAVMLAVLRMLPVMVEAMLTSDWERFCDKSGPILQALLGPAACDPDGNSLYPISVEDYPDAMSQTQEKLKTGEFDYRVALADAIGPDHVYCFVYDWRLSPIDHAKALREYIQKVKRETGHDKVTLMGVSMGGTTVLSYLDQFGHEDVARIVMQSSAWNGVELVGDLYSGVLSLDAQALVRFIEKPAGDSAFAQTVVGGILNILDTIGAFDFLEESMEEVTDMVGGRIYEEFLTPVLGQMPGMLALIPAEAYPKARDFLLDESVHKELLKKTDAYYETSLKTKELLDAAVADGVTVAVTANYNISGAPFGNHARYQNDNLIETCNASGGATCALLDETLGEDYTQAVDCGHNHLSPDGIIDASTCLFPEQTWFFKDLPHVEFGISQDTADFLVWLTTAEKAVTVRSRGDYPQFMEIDQASGKLIQLGGGENLEAEPCAVTPLCSINGMNSIEYTEYGVTRLHFEDALKSRDETWDVLSRFNRAYGYIFDRWMI